MSVNNKQWYGLPLNLIWGYVAIAVFMTGDGFELAFLSHYIKALGFTPAQASFAFTLYGLAAALSAWVSGVVAEIITPRKAMLIGFVLWCVFHVLFLVFGLGRANYALILLFYGIRGLAYPLFLYSFIVAIIHNVRSDSSSSALGWFWAVYSGGYRRVRQLYSELYHSPHWRNGHPVAGAALLRHRRHYCAGVDASYRNAAPYAEPDHS
ncbi:ribitol/Xylitol/Arabitol transporter, MFS superfamily [Klebsiella pneumoniae]|uniref:Ribitol/Xylitol/Arabitol transporter, MFS superfamily n=1 Tax=Klebsiella pneumoniae TaxID=573 RepID=A0A378C5J7_KLEPN|nr:ribitol/Xylitol/Arabitol transporter, MFS superfamily [Klebsiella pneumoniae]